MRKNILGIIAVSALAISISACGGSSSDSASPDASELSPEAAAGKTYFEETCGSCHSIDGGRSTGPTFKGLAGSTVQLQDGRSVTADMSYLMKSITDPAADVVKGYPNIMGAAIEKGSVSSQDAHNIASYIETLR